MSHHRIAWAIIAASGLLVLLDGLLFAAVQHIPAWHGIYCIWMTAITVGGDVQPAGAGYACLAFAPFPLLAAAFSLFTSALANIHVRRAERNIKAHCEVLAPQVQNDVTKQSSADSTRTP